MWMAKSRCEVAASNSWRPASEAPIAASAARIGAAMLSA
jgi:hypothetical protein